MSGTQRTRSRPRRSTFSRGFAVVLVLLTVVVGAAAGASVGGRSRTTYTASAEVVVVTGAGTDADARLGRLRDLLRLQNVLGYAASSVAIPDLASRIAVKQQRAAPVITVTGRGSTPTAARAVANADVSFALQFDRMIEGLRRGRLDVGSFEHGLDDWGFQAPLLAEPPRHLERARGDARFGRYFLRTTCARARDCGPYVRIYYPFAMGVQYDATAWARTRSGHVSARLVFGVGAKTRSRSRVLDLGPRWRRITVSWVPPHDVDAAEVALVLPTRRRTVVDLDGVSIADSRVAQPAPASAAFFETSPGDVYARPAVLTGSRTERGVIRDVLAGAGIGLVVGLIGAALGRAASRRQQA